MVGAHLYFLFRLRFAIFEFSHQILQRVVLMREKLIGRVYQTSNEKVLRVHQNMHQKFPISDLYYELVKSFEIYHMYCTGYFYQRKYHIGYEDMINLQYKNIDRTFLQTTTFVLAQLTRTFKRRQRMLLIVFLTISF